MRLARQPLFAVAAQIFKYFLLALLDLEENRFGEPRIISLCVDLAGLQQDFPQVSYALLCKQHLILGLYHTGSNSTIPRFRKVLDVW